MRRHLSKYIKVRAIMDSHNYEMNSKEENELRTLPKLQRAKIYLDPCAKVLTFERGDKMMTISPENIGDSVRWWMVRHLDSGKIGFIPRRCVVIDSAAEDQPVKTTINQLPLELLDILLRKSNLHYALSGKESTDKRDKFLVFRLSSVDLCWFERLRKHRFKKSTERHLSKFFKEFRRGIAIFTSNRSYLEENIQPNGLINLLRSADCLTDVETRLLSRQTLTQSTKKLFRKNNNPDLLHVIRSFDDRKLSDFIHCLYKSNQKLITEVAVFGGVLLKAIILNQDTAKTQSLVQTINDLRDNTKVRSYQMEKLVSQLKDDNIEILNSFLDRHAVVWIWCQSQTGLKKVQKLNEYNSLMDVFTGLTTPPTSSSEITKPKAVSICRDQFKRSVEDPNLAVGSLSNDEIKDRIQNIYAEFVSGVEPGRLTDYLVQGNVITPSQWQKIRNSNPTTQDHCRALLNHLFSIRHPTAFLVIRQALSEENHHILEHINNQKPGKLGYIFDPVLVQTIRTKAVEEENKSISGLTILDKELFVVSEGSSEVHVYDSIKYKFSFNRRWNLKELIRPYDIGSCNRNKCLYIFDYKGSYAQSKEILRVDPNGKLIKNWSTGNDYGRGLSVTDESNIILTVYNKHKLNEYSSDGQLIREISLSSDAGIRYPWHAIKLTNGHFVVSHGFHDDELHRVCAVDGVGKLTKSFGGICGSTMEQMNRPTCMAVDGNGFVMVVDPGNNRVLLLDSDLKFKREILLKKTHELPKILLDESYGRLLVTNSVWYREEQMYQPGQILNFVFK